MDKELRRMLELSGIIEKNEVVDKLYENFHDSESTSIYGFEGPFKMKNGRVVHYKLSEKKFYDCSLDHYLTEDEVTALYEDGEFSHGVVLHAKKGDEKISLTIEEGMMGMTSVVTTLQNNGYSDFEYTDEDGERKPFEQDEVVEEAKQTGKTEHSGAKKGKGAYYGRKKDAKDDSNKARRAADRKQAQMDEGSDDVPSREEIIADVIKHGPDSEHLYFISEEDLEKLIAAGKVSDDIYQHWVNAQEELSYMMQQARQEFGESSAMKGTGQEHNASSLISILKYYGDDISDEQYAEVMSYVDELDSIEQGKVLDFMRHMKGKLAPGEVPAHMEGAKGRSRDTKLVNERDAMSRGAIDRDVDIDDIEAPTGYGMDTHYVKLPSQRSAEHVKDYIENEYGLDAEVEYRQGSRAPYHVAFHAPDDIADRIIRQMHKTFYTNEGEELEETAKGRSRDTKVTPSLSRSLNKRNKKAAKSRDRQNAKKDIKVDEDAQNITAFDNNAFPADAVDDQQQKDERTGRADRTGVKNKVPSEVLKAIDTRIKELTVSIDRYDNTGYNDKSVKNLSVDALKKIRENLSRGDHEGFMEAQIFFTTLMSPIWDMIPAQVVNYLGKGSDE